MRLNPDLVNFLTQLIRDRIPGSSVFLFGSRTDDTARGGDIDLLILTDQPVDRRIMRLIRLEFIKKYGWRKIDLVNFTYSNQSVFRKLIDLNCIQL